MLYTQIKEAASDMQEYLSELYHGFHRHPELSHAEFHTAERIRAELDRLGISWRAVGTGTIADIGSGKTGPFIALRADIDALPIEEKNTFEYASENRGVMHACGHDSHITMLLGAAKLLTRFSDSLAGPVRLIFQPAEEKGGGSRDMIEVGALEDINEIYCLHAGPGIATGKFVTKPGTIHASSDGIRITVSGKSAHGSVPQLGIDAIVAASHTVLALQDIISREVSCWNQAVLTIGAFHGGTARNIVCDNVVMDATLRTLDEDTRTLMHRRIVEVCEGTARVHRCNAKVEFVQTYCSNYNSPELTQKAFDVAEALYGKDGISLLEQPAMEGEDFGAYLQQVPGVKLYIGTGCEDRLHTDRFHIDESMLPNGAALLTALCV